MSIGNDDQPAKQNLLSFFTVFDIYRRIQAYFRQRHLYDLSSAMALGTTCFPITDKLLKAKQADGNAKAERLHITIETAPGDFL